MMVRIAHAGGQVQPGPNPEVTDPAGIWYGRRLNLLFSVYPRKERAPSSFKRGRKKLDMSQVRKICFNKVNKNVLRNF